jgi:hypothetical protein
MNARIRALTVLLVAALGCSSGDDVASGNASPHDDSGGIATCVPGKADLCACAGGQPGVQTCGPDGTFRPCECRGSSEAGVSDASGNESTHDDVAGESGNPSTDDGGGDSVDACTQGGFDPGHTCACDGGQKGVQLPDDSGGFGPCVCPRGSDAGVSDAGAAVTCNGSSYGNNLTPGCPPVRDSVVCLFGYGDCSDGQRYNVACVAEQDGTMTCQCDISGSGGIAYHASSCDDLLPAGGTSPLLMRCGWNLCSSYPSIMLPPC